MKWTTRDVTTAEKLKFWNWFSPWHACCLFGYTRPREPINERIVVTRMQHLVSEFSKKFSGMIGLPRTPTAGGGDPSRTHSQPDLWPGAGRKRPVLVLEPKPWSPQLFSRSCGPDLERGRPIWTVSRCRDCRPSALLRVNCLSCVYECAQWSKSRLQPSGLRRRAPWQLQLQHRKCFNNY